MGIKEDVEQFEKKVASLKVEHEMFFMKAVKRDPAKLAKHRDELDKFVLNYSNKGSSNTQYKFRLNTAIAKYGAYKQYWNRMLHDIDEGKFSHRAEGGGMPSMPAPSGNNHLRPAAKEPSAGETRDLTGGPEAAPVFSAPPQSPPQPRGDDVEDIYRKFIEARRQCNEPTEGITVESLSKSIAQSKKLIEDKYKTSNVELKVLIKDGKAKLTIVPKK